MLKKLIIAASLIAMGAPTLAAAEPMRPAQFQQVADRQYYMVDGHRYEAQRGPAWCAPHGYQHRQWNRNDRLPVEYRRVVVTDYRHHHLAPPPRGERWVRVDNDAVLVGITSGIIGAVVANAFAN